MTTYFEWLVLYYAPTDDFTKKFKEFESLNGIGQKVLKHFSYF